MAVGALVPAWPWDVVGPGIFASLSVGGGLRQLEVVLIRVTKCQDSKRELITLAPAWKRRMGGSQVKLRSP